MRVLSLKLIFLDHNVCVHLVTFCPVTMVTKPTAPSCSRVSFDLPNVNSDNSEELQHGKAPSIYQANPLSHIKERLLVCLVVVLGLTVLVQLHFILQGWTDKSQWVRDKSNGSHNEWRLVSPVRVTPPCPTGHVWSIREFQCVHAASNHSDINIFRSASNNSSKDAPSIWTIKDEIFYNQRRQQPRFHGGERKREEEISRDNKPTHKIDVNLINELFPSHPCLFSLTGTLLTHPRACHMYYNCSLSPRDPKWKTMEPLTAKCPFPQLFSTTTSSCRSRTEVDCGSRLEYTTRCEDHRNTCNYPGCTNCEYRQNKCAGHSSGVYPVLPHAWTPWFIVCKDGLTEKQGRCGHGASVFSPVTRTCISLDQVPREHGELRDSCRGRSDGYHLEETGICHTFFYCKDEQQRGFKSCANGFIFDPSAMTCRDAQNVFLPPCGQLSYKSSGRDEFCEGQTDGFYADLYGRCSLYYECKNRKLRAYLKCPYGSYNPRTQKCHTMLEIPAPCGIHINPCKEKLDGVYTEPESNCRTMIHCRNGYVSAVIPCPEGRVFDTRTKKCQRQDSTSECGIFPSCIGKSDGRFASIQKGCQYYFTCSNEVFIGYGSCGSTGGSRIFNPKTGMCDFLQNVCPPCGRKKNCSEI